MRTNTVRVKIDDQCDILVTVPGDSMMEEDSRIDCCPEALRKFPTIYT